MAAFAQPAIAMNIPEGTKGQEMYYTSCSLLKLVVGPVLPLTGVSKRHVETKIKLCV